MFCLNWHSNFHILHDIPIEIKLVLWCSRKYPYSPHGRLFFHLNPHPTENSSLGSYFHFNTFAFLSPSSPLGFSNDPIGLVWMFSGTTHYSLAVYTLHGEQTLRKNNIKIVWKIQCNYVDWSCACELNNSTSNSLFKYFQSKHYNEIDMNGMNK